MNKFDLTDKTAIITGGAQGFGLDIAKKFLNYGARVRLWDIDEKELKKVKNKINNSNLEIDVVDVTNYKVVIDTVDNISKTSKIDILINNAGITGPTAELWNYNVDDWKKIIDINLHGTFYACREFLKLATEQKIDAGAIVNVASIMGVRASGAQAPYAASKHAVVGLTKSIAQDYANMNIRANAIGPGVIDTPMNTELMKDENIMQYMLQRIPMNRVATSDEVANLIYFLASSEASYITGSYYPIDGGYLAS